MDEKLVIKTAGLKNEQEITNLFQRSYATLMKETYVPDVLSEVLPKMTTANPKLLSSNKFYFISLEENQIVSCGGWSMEKPGEQTIIPGTAHIRHFATDPNWIRKGFGRMIYEKCEKDARLEGVHSIECYSSINAERFYSSLGFEKIEKIEIPFGPNVSFPVIFMRKKISD